LTDLGYNAHNKAKDRGEAPVFLFVAGSSFLDRLATAVVVDITGNPGCFGRGGLDGLPVALKV
jgi:hypothetical protein